MYQATKSGLTLTKQSTIWKHYSIIACLVLMFGLAMYGNVKQYLHAQTFETTIQQKDQDLEAARRERDDAKDKLQKRIDKIMDISDAIRSTYPNVPKNKAIMMADAQIRYSQQYKIETHIGLGISGIESGFNPNAVSYNGTSHGSMQVHYKVWKKELPGLTLKCLHDIDCGIKTGYKILARYRELNKGNMYAAMKSYYGATDTSENVKYANRVFLKAMYFKSKIG